MYCPNCGNKIDNQKYCPNCGTMNRNNIQPEPKNNNETAGIILGIISLVLNFIIFFFAIPLSIIGLVFSKKAKKQTNRMNAGIVLNIISLVIGIINLIICLVIVFIIGISIKTLFSTEIKEKTLREQQEQTYKRYEDNPSIDKTPLIGEWNCSNLNNQNKYVFKIELDKNGKYKIGDYETYKKNYAKGEYVVTDKKNKEYIDYSLIDYTIYFKTTDEYKENGKEQKDKAFYKYYILSVIDGNLYQKNYLLLTEEYKTHYICKKEG